MREDSWFRSALLSVLLLVGLALFAGPLTAQNSADREEFLHALLTQIHDADKNGDTRFLKNLAAMSYAGGPLDDLSETELPPFSPDHLLRYLVDRVHELSTENLQLLMVGASRLRGSADVVAVGWWGCASGFLSDLGTCWDVYFNCMDPGPHGPGGAPDRDWCRSLFDACLDVARSRYDECLSDDADPY